MAKHGLLGRRRLLQVKLCLLRMHLYSANTNLLEIKVMLKVDSDKLKKVNAFGQMMIASRHGNTPVKKGDKLAGTRIIPLVIEKEKMHKAAAICADGPILELKEFHKKKVGIITTIQ